MRGRRDDVFHVLSVVRGVVEETREATEAAVKDPAGDRAAADALLLLGEGTPGTSIRPILHLLIGEREELGKALATIRRSLDQAGIGPDAGSRWLVTGTGLGADLVTAVQWLELAVERLEASLKPDRIGEIAQRVSAGARFPDVAVVKDVHARLGDVEKRIVNLLRLTRAGGTKGGPE